MEEEIASLALDKGADGEAAIMRVELDTGALLTATEEAGKFVLNPKAEESIIRLLEMEKLVGKAMSYIKMSLEQAGLAYSPHFSSVSGKQVKITYQSSGATYVVQEDKVKRHNPAFFKRKVVYALDSKAVGKYEEKHHGNLPENVTRAKRNKNIQIRPAKELGL